MAGCVVIIHRATRAAVCRSLSLHCSEIFLDSLKLLPQRSARHHPGPFLRQGEQPVDDKRKLELFIPPWWLKQELGEEYFWCAGVRVMTQAFGEDFSFTMYNNNLCIFTFNHNFTSFYYKTVFYGIDTSFWLCLFENWYLGFGGQRKLQPCVIFFTSKCLLSGIAKWFLEVTAPSQGLQYWLFYFKYLPKPFHASSTVNRMQEFAIKSSILPPLWPNRSCWVRPSGVAPLYSTCHPCPDRRDPWTVWFLPLPT